MAGWQDDHAEETSKKVKEVVDKFLLPVVVHLNRRFWDDTRNHIGKYVKHKFVLRHLEAMTSFCPGIWSVLLDMMTN